MNEAKRKRERSDILLFNSSGNQFVGNMLEPKASVLNYVKIRASFMLYDLLRGPLRPI